MPNESKSCIVSPPRGCNRATTVKPDETDSETIVQPTNLLALAQRVLDKNKCNNSRNYAATDRLHHDNISQQRELRKLIRIISQHYGDDDEDFLAGYADEIIRLHINDLSIAIECFKDLATQKNPLNKWK